MSDTDPAAALSGARMGNICDRCNGGVWTGDLVRVYATRYEDDGWVLRRLWCGECGDANIEHGTEGADETVIEAVFWNHQLAGVEILDRSLPGEHS